MKAEATGAGQSVTTMSQALSDYFADNGFGKDGGYSDKWVDFRLGPIPFPFPNTPARVRALRYHDLHHILTGYRTDLRGEMEISAWEIGAGCKDFVAAWQLNLGGLGLGMVLIPRRTTRAFLRGRHNDTLYGRPYEPLLGRDVADLARETGADRASGPRAGWRDAVALTAATTAGLVVGVVGAAVGTALLPWGLYHFAQRRLGPARSGTSSAGAGT